MTTFHEELRQAALNLGAAPDGNPRKWLVLFRAGEQLRCGATPQAVHMRFKSAIPGRDGPSIREILARAITPHPVIALRLPNGAASLVCTPPRSPVTGFGFVTPGQGAVQGQTLRWCFYTLSQSWTVRVGAAHGTSAYVATEDLQWAARGRWTVYSASLISAGLMQRLVESALTRFCAGEERWQATENLHADQEQDNNDEIPF